MTALRRLFALLALSTQLSVLSPVAAAAEPAQLAPDLRYLRLHFVTPEAAHALADALLKPTALVLDLRYVADGAEAAAALGALDSQPAKPPLYVLVSPETPKVVAKALAATSARLVLIGIADSRPQPAVVVEQTAANDRSAYVALESGATLEALVAGKIDKERFDEAELVKEFKNGNPNAHPAEGSPDGTTASVRLTDRVLQRALHLHLALQALKR